MSATARSGTRRRCHYRDSWMRSGGTPSRTTETDFARDVIFKGLTLYGVTGRKMYETWHQMRRFLLAGQLDPRPVITHRFPLECIGDAIQVIKAGEAGKVILEVGA